MLGQIILDTSVRGKIHYETMDIMGLPILRVRMNGEGFMRERRLRRVLRKMKQYGVRCMLPTAHFDGWEIVRDYGINCMSPVPFLRENAAELILLAMKQNGCNPAHSVVALRGTRVCREMILTAENLVSCVRDIAISAPVGGAELQAELRKRWGLAVRPDSADVSDAICFDQLCNVEGETVLLLYDDGLDLGGLCISEDKVVDFCEAEPLSVLGALWQTGRLKEDAIEFYLT